MRLLLLTLFTAVTAFSQLSASNPGVSVYVTRSVSLAPEKVYIYVTVETGIDTTAEAAAQVVSSLSITAADLQGLSDVPGESNRMAYGFLTSAPYGKQKDFIASIAAIQKRLADQNSTYKIGYRIRGLSGNDRYVDENRVQLMSALLTDARKKAQGMAEAGGFNIGRILNISDISILPAAGGPFYNSTLSTTVGVSVVFALQ